MAWMGLTILMMTLDVSLLVSRSGAEPKISITKCRLVEGNTVVCRVRNKERLNEDKTFRGKEAKVSERASIFGLGRRISQRQRSKCYLDGSTIRCDGGLKLTGVGSVGRRGSPGLPGPKVGKGEKGGLGSPGRPGPDGKEGPRGFKGPKGDRGSRGEKGDNGDVGREGPQGNPGTPSSCLSVPTTSSLCPRGRPGRKGIKGSTGKEGPLGFKGTKGHRGAKGNKGARGAAGMRGSIGLYGALTLKKPCRQMYSPWVVPNASPIGKLRTECVYREYLMSLEIQPNRSNSKIRYSYKCCPFKASDASKKTFF